MSLRKPKIVDWQSANPFNREMLRCGVKPQMSRISKIIYDPSTGNVYVKDPTHIRNTS